jgi:nucleotide-binding universal stress UspA family protein
VSKLLVAMDFTDVSRPACRFAAQYALGLEAGEIYFLHVLGDEAQAGSDAALAAIEQAIARMRGVAERELVTADGRPLPEAVALRYRAVHGQADEAILRVAREHDVDAIVVGTSSRQGLERMLLGSVAESVVRGAHCTVMVVKSPSNAPR